MDAKKTEDYSLKMVSNTAYQVVDRRSDDSTLQESVRPELADTTYAIIPEGNQMKESQYETATITTKNDEPKRNMSEIFPHGKVIICLSVITIVVVIVSCVCFLSAFIEISRLKSDIAFLRQASPITANSTASSGEQWCSTDQCISTKEILHSIEGLDQLNQSYLSIENQLQNLNNTLAGQFQNYPATSCAALFLLNSSSPSGDYWVRSANSSAVRVYCDMTLSCGNITGGWMRVANLNITDTGTQCPSTLIERINSNIRTCGFNSEQRTCLSLIVPSYNMYSKVCGKIKAYQFGSTDAFSTTSSSISSFYVDGISLTYGNPRKHIWTFASAQDEVAISAPSNCPCINTNQASNARGPPEFVGNDYFCDTGSAGRVENSRFYSDDPLWDGAGCGPLNTCCTLNSPPWFYKQLPEPTTDDIEMRVCRDGVDEDIALEMAHIYIQ